MTITGKIACAKDLTEAKALMVELLMDWKATGSPAGSPADSIMRFEIELDKIDPLNWLIDQTIPGRIYWRERDESFIVAGLGIADIVDCDNSGCYQSVLNSVSSRLANSTDNIRYFGGFRFDQKYPNFSNEWKSFGAGCLTLPRFEILNKNDKSLFVCNLLPVQYKKNIDQIISELSQVNTNISDRIISSPTLLNRSDQPDREGWKKIVDDSLEAFKKTELEKIVLARCSDFEFDQKISPVRLLSKLSNVAVDCFHFCFEPVASKPENSSAFIGVTPELLYSRQGQTLKTEAIAGTRPRGIDQQADQKYEKSLLGCEKDMREQNHVVTDIKHALQKLGTLTNSNGNGNPRLLKLARVQHLITRFESELKSEIGDWETLQAIHPTPAVGGCPNEMAIEKISSYEPFDRGWYAGPVGWISKDSATFAVGIRSGLVSDKTLKLYSGAGIVRGSTAEREWKEIENKLKSYLEIF